MRLGIECKTKGSSKNTISVARDPNQVLQQEVFPFFNVQDRMLVELIFIAMNSMSESESSIAPQVLAVVAVDASQMNSTSSSDKHSGSSTTAGALRVKEKIDEGESV
jgi:hypothetical protein